MFLKEFVCFTERQKNRTLRVCAQCATCSYLISEGEALVVKYFLVTLATANFPFSALLFSVLTHF